jgi:thioesterase domain-containing protein/acyl carrier protein
LRLINLGGEIVSKQDIENYKRYFAGNCILLNHFGCTELSSYRQYIINKSTQIDHSIIPNGYATEDNEVLIIDEDGEVINDGRVGEIVVKSPYLALGYWQQPDLTAAAFRFDGSQQLYRTGDLGRLMPDGCLINLGRKDFQVKIRGYRVEIGEIEVALLEHPDIKEAVVRDWDNEVGEKFLAAYIVSYSGQIISNSVIRNFLQQKLPHYMVPTAFVMLDALPLTASGKTNRLLLLPPNQYQQKPREVSIAPRDEIELQIAKIWEKVLGIPSVGMRDNFFDLGGHSLLAVRLLDEIEKTFAKKLNLTATTVEEQANYLRELSTDNALAKKRELGSLSSVITIQSQGFKTPLFCIHVLGEGLKFYRPMLKYLGTERPLYGLNTQLFAKKLNSNQKVEALAARYIEDMRTLQPEGPYYLVGISFGGKVAFEMARQLDLQGQQVALLALLDTSAPGAIQKLPTQKRILSHWNNYSQQGSAYLRSKARGFITGKLTKLHHQLHNRSKRTYSKLCLALGYPLPQSCHSFMVRQENLQISRSYDPQPYNGKITLFRAIARNLRIASTIDSKLGWEKLARQGVEVHQIPGSHLGMLEEPNVQFLAEKLKYCADNAIHEQATRNPIT